MVLRLGYLGELGQYGAEIVISGRTRAIWHRGCDIWAN